MDPYIDFPASLFYDDVGGKKAAYKDYDLIYRGGGEPIVINESVSSDDDVAERAKIVELMDTGCDAVFPESNGTRRASCERGGEKKSGKWLRAEEKIWAQPRVKEPEGGNSSRGTKFHLSSESCPIELDLHNVFDILRNGEKLGRTDVPRRTTMADGKGAVEDSGDFVDVDRCYTSNDSVQTNSIEHSERTIKTRNPMLSAIPRLVKMDKRRNELDDKRGGNCCFRFGKRRNLEGSRLPIWQGLGGKEMRRSGGGASMKTMEQPRPSDERTDRPFNHHDPIEINLQNNYIDCVKTEQMGEMERLLMDEKCGKADMEITRREEVEEAMLRRQKDASTIGEYRDRVEAAETSTSSSLKKVEKEWNKNEEDDQSASDMWSEKYEKAFAKGHSIGAKILRMARATRDERKRLFREYGFENYNRNPRKMPQEILDIGLSLVEKYVEKDDIDRLGNESMIVQNYSTNRTIFSQHYSRLD